MLDLSGHINALLRNYDCVIIPGFGGFIANYSSSVLDKDKGVVFPPSKGILFNKNLNRNDGLLANQIAESNEISYAQAIETLEQFVHETLVALQKGGRVEFSGIGYIYFDAEKNLQFLPYQTNNFLADSFGLRPVNAVPLVKKVKPVVTPVEVIKPEEKIIPVKIQEEKIVEKEEAKIVEFTPKKEEKVAVKKSRAKYYWAAAVLLPIIFYSLWIPLKTPFLTTGHFDVSYLNPFKKYELPVYATRGEETFDITTVDSLLNANSVEEIELEPEVHSAESTYVDQPLVDGEKRFHVIAGCFINHENAISQINELKAKGINAYQIGQANGFFRVAMGSYSSKLEAMAELSNYRASGQPNSWLLEE